MIMYGLVVDCIVLAHRTLTGKDIKAGIIFITRDRNVFFTTFMCVVITSYIGKHGK